MTTGIITKNMYKQGDIVTLPFPFEEDQTQNKLRPVVIISKDSVNKGSYIVLKITSVLGKSSFEIPIFKKDVDFEMQRASAIISNDIMTVSQKIIHKKIGRLNSHALETLSEVVKNNFEIE
jgi:mRNA-degrading endonuclease toxin of MazEF toxin-antitoxin module